MRIYFFDDLSQIEEQRSDIALNYCSQSVALEITALHPATAENFLSLCPWRTKKLLQYARFFLSRVISYSSIIMAFWGLFCVLLIRFCYLLYRNKNRKRDE